MKYEKKNVLIIEWSSLPEDIKEIISEWRSFGNDCILELHSELSPSSKDSWKFTLTQEQLEIYYKDQTSNFDGNFEEFIDEYGLRVEKFLIDQKLDLTGVDNICFKISW